MTSRAAVKCPEEHSNLNCNQQLAERLNTIQNPRMTALAKKLDEHFQKLDSATLRQIDQVFMSLIAVFEKRLPQPATPSVYHLRTRSLGVRRDLDLTKLAHADEDLDFPG
jgi:hypothetical protein